MRFVAIVALALLAGITYGILHDQVTARVCVEYFTIGHPPIFRTTSPTLLAIGWGIVATWWVALPLGFSLACAARLGERPKLSAGNLVRPLLILLGAMALLAFVAGTLGYVLATTGSIRIDPWVLAAIEPPKQAAFTADWWAHTASYFGGFVGAIVLCTWVWRSRRVRRAQ
jgi:membrane associated rhomboid family serine protease